MFQFPLEEPVIIFAIAMVIFFLSPIIMNKLRIPGIIGPILAGVIVGPNGLNLLARDQTIVLLGTVGLLFIIFIAGLELDIDGFKKYRNRSIIFGLLSFNIPLILGTVVSLLLGYNLMASILIGSIVGSHTLLAYPIASRLGVAKKKAVTTAVGGTLLTDTLALLILAVITGAAEGQLSFAFWSEMVVSLTIFVFIVLWGTPIISKWYFRNSLNEGIANFTFVMVILFTAACIAVVINMQPIIGAFLAGLALNRYVLDHGTLMNRIRFIGNALFIPFFLLSVGMLMDLKVLFTNPKAWIVTLAILFAVFIGKWLASLITSKVYGYSSNEKNVIFGLTIPQAAATLASTLVGFEVGLLDQSTVNAVIIMILITCFMGPYLVEKYSREIALKEETKAPDQNRVPERILIPLSNPETAEALMDLSFLIKQPNTDDQPLYPLKVVLKDMKSVEAEVANAEKMLSHSLEHAASAEVPVRLVTKVDNNVSDGIIRAIAEERINTVVIGWNAERTSNKLFGSVLDRLIDQTGQTVLVTKLGHPLNTTNRIVLIIPFGADHKPGFYEALGRIKMLTSKLNASLFVYVIKGSVDIYERHMKEVKPNPPTEVEHVSGWSDLREEYQNELKDDDLVIILSARKGTVAWHPQLEELPKQLSAVKPESFIIYYPREEMEVDIRGSRGLDVPKEILRKKDYDYS
ncbi:cation:proton antiporter [Oceanobacillus salinisoli]|uniref:cation:proton antiporter n=1 Tax=Oceanobacillus salinisoli TaxID=2678611 RepID=UPI0012E22163|nr:cation:proton antiporter [Oceanobacillus salinisoli]